MSTYIHQMGTVQRPFSTSNAVATDANDTDTFQHIRPSSGIDTSLSLVLSRQSSCDSDRYNSSLYSSSSNSGTAAVSTRSSTRSTAHRLVRQRTGSSSNMSNIGSNDAQNSARDSTTKQQQLPQHQQKLQQMPATAQADKAITGRFFAASSFNQLSLNSPRIGPASASPQLHVSQWNTNANSSNSNSSSGIALSRSSGYSSLGDVIQAARDSCNGTANSTTGTGNHQQQQQHHFDTSTDETDVSAYIGQAVKVCMLLVILYVLLSAFGP
jgi:hypothetical protein